MKRVLMLLLAALMILSMSACGEDDPVVLLPTESNETKGTTPDRGELVILFTGGLDGVYDQDTAQGAVCYAALAAYADELEDDGHTVVLLDGGCSVDGRGPEGLWDIVNGCGYDIRIPGALELAAGVEKLLEREEDLKYCTFLSCNLMDLERNTTVLAPYALVDVGDIQVGFVGVTDPWSLAPEDLQHYGLLGADDAQTLYDAVQQAVDDAADAGAAFVVVVGNLGTAPEDSPLTTVEVISDITGMVAWLDCGSGAVLDGDTVADKDDFEIPLCAPGSGFRYVGRVELDLNEGTATVKLLTEFEEEDRTVRHLINDLNEELEQE